MSKSIRERYREYQKSTRSLFSDSQKTQVEELAKRAGPEADFAVEFRRTVRSIFGDIPLGLIDLRVPKKRK